MNHQQLKEKILTSLKAADKPLTPEGAMVIIRELLKDYPKQLEEFGEWFEKNAASVIARIDHE